MKKKTVEVSLFEGVANPEPTDERITLSEVLEQIEIGGFQEEVTSIRHLTSEGRLKEAEAKKKLLYAFTPSGVFSRRSKDQIIEYSGVICLDFDNLSEADLWEVRSLVESDPHTFCCFLSPSGNGLKVLTRVDSHMEKHDLAYMIVGAHYKQLIKKDFDSSCKDLPRLCFLSWDKNLYVNKDAKILCIPSEPVIEPKLRDYSESLRRCREFTNRLQSFEQGNRNNYVHQFACNANRMGIPEVAARTYADANFVSDNLLSEEVSNTVISGYRNPKEYASYLYPQISNHCALSVIDLIEENKGKPQNIPIWLGIRQPSIGFIYGPSKSGKSTFSESLGMSIALGRDNFFNKAIVGQRKKSVGILGGVCRFADN